MLQEEASSWYHNGSVHKKQVQTSAVQVTESCSYLAKMDHPGASHEGDDSYRLVLQGVGCGGVQMKDGYNREQDELKRRH